MELHRFRRDTQGYRNLLMALVVVAAANKDFGVSVRVMFQRLVDKRLQLVSKQLFRITSFEGSDAQVQFPSVTILQILDYLFSSTQTLQIIQAFVLDDG